MIANELRRFSKAFRGEVFPYKRWNLKRRCIFVHIPKCGGTSVLAAIGAPTTGRCHAPWHEYANTNNWMFDNFFKFSVIRNPIARLESAFHYVRNGSNQSEFGLQLANYVKEKFEDYDDFLASADPNTLFKFPPFRPQYTYITDELGNLKVDMLVDLDNLNEAATRLSKAMRVPKLTFKSMNTTRYQKTQKNIPTWISDFYAEDFRLLESVK